MGADLIKGENREERLQRKGIILKEQGGNGDWIRGREGRGRRIRRRVDGKKSKRER